MPPPSWYVQYAMSGLRIIILLVIPISVVSIPAGGFCALSVRTLLTDLHFQFLFLNFFFTHFKQLIFFHYGIKHLVSCCYRNQMDDGVVRWSRVAVTTLKFVYSDININCRVPYIRQQITNDLLMKFFHFLSIYSHTEHCGIYLQHLIYNVHRHMKFSLGSSYVV